MPITSSWYQCSVEAQLALMSDSMQFILMPWLSWHSTHFLNADQRRKSLLLLLRQKLPASPFLGVTTHHSFKPGVYLGHLLCIVWFGPHLCEYSVETLSLCPPCSSPPSASNSALQTQHMPHRSTTTTSRYGTRTPSSPRPGNWHPVSGIQHGRGE